MQGDKVIQFAASVLQNNVRQEDIAARIGGEEFALLLVNIGANEALPLPNASACPSVNSMKGYRKE